MSAGTVRLNVSVTIEPPVRTVLANWDGKSFLVKTISADFYFRDGGFTRQRIEAGGPKLKKDGTPGAVWAKSTWVQEFSPEVHRRLKVAAESIVKAAAKAEVPS